MGERERKRERAHRLTNSHSDKDKHGNRRIDDRGVAVVIIIFV